MPIEARELKYIYSPKTPFAQTALENINLYVSDGEYLGIIGHTGSGKTTLIKLLAGLIKPLSGSVFLHGEDIFEKKYDKKKLRNAVGVLFQYPEYQLFEETVYADIAFGPKKQGLDESEIDARVRYACELLEFDIDKLRERSPFELSGGQKRKAAIAGVLACNPSVLILDEPVAGLDPKGREQLFSFLKKLNQNGVTIILITHSMDDLANNVNRVVALNEGRLVLDGAPKEIFSNAQELKNMGLELPQVTNIANELSQAGINLPDGIISIDEFCNFFEGLNNNA